MKKLIKQIKEFLRSKFSFLSLSNIRFNIENIKPKLPAFSLIELMISLITISLITSSFTPVISKKIKNGSLSVGGLSGISIKYFILCLIEGYYPSILSQAKQTVKKY